MFDNVSNDVTWHPAVASVDASEIDEPRARGAYLDPRLPWVLGVSMMGSAAALFGSYLELAIH